MGDGAKVVAVVASVWLLLGQCSGDPVTGAKAAVGGAAVGAGVGAGAAAGGAAGAAAKAAAQRAKNRAHPAPQLGVPVTSTTFPVLEFDAGGVRVSR